MLQRPLAEVRLGVARRSVFTVFDLDLRFDRGSRLVVARRWGFEVERALFCFVREVFVVRFGFETPRDVLIVLDGLARAELERFRFTDRDVFVPERG